MSFQPSFSFYDPPGKRESPQVPAKPYIRHEPVNTLKKREVKPESPTDITAKYELFNSVALSKLSQDEEEVKEPDLPPIAPINPSEVQNPALNKALNGNFAEIKKSRTKTAPRKKFKPGNYVKQTLSKGRSFSKMGRTLAGNPKYKKKRQYFTSTGVQREEDVCFSEGYLNRELLEQVDSSYEGLTRLLQEEFEFETWREGQYETIESLFQENRTLAIITTGGGKSLCFQMYARTKGGVIVLCPLLSLVTNHILKLPKNISGALLLSTQPYALKQSIIEQFNNRQIDILFTTPENFLIDKLNYNPNVNLLCFDEAHSLSIHSHTFRSVYAQMQLLEYKCNILALTAPICKEMQRDIQQTFGIQEDRVFRYGRYLPDNINISVHHDDGLPQDIALKLIKSPRFAGKSVLVFAFTKQETESIADWLKHRGIPTSYYHSTVSEQKRRSIVNEFLNGKIKVVVSTIALSLGIDKPDLQGIILLHPPKSLEHFMQVVGRAGRNGEEAEAAIVFHVNQLFRIRSLLYSDFIDLQDIYNVVRRIGQVNDLKRARDGLADNLDVLNIKELSDQLALNRDFVIYLFILLHQKRVIQFKGVLPSIACVRFYRHTPEELAQKYAIISQVIKNGRNLAGVRKVKIKAVAESLEISIEETIQALRRLQGAGEITCEFDEDALIAQPLQISNEALNEVAQQISSTFTSYVHRLESVFMLLRNNASPLTSPEIVSPRLEYQIGNFFRNSEAPSQFPQLPIYDHLEMDLECLYLEFDDPPTPKDLVSVLLGLNTPRVSRERWCRHHLWQSYAKHTFMQLYIEARRFIEGQEHQVKKEIGNEEIVDKQNGEAFQYMSVGLYSNYQRYGYYLQAKVARDSFCSLSHSSTEKSLSQSSPGIFRNTRISFAFAVASFLFLDSNILSQIPCFS